MKIEFQELYKKFLEMYWDGDINNALKVDWESRDQHQGEVDSDINRESFYGFATERSMDFSGQVRDIYDATEYMCVYLENVFIVDEGTKVLRFYFDGSIHYPLNSPLPKVGSLYSFSGRIGSASYSWGHMQPRHIHARYGFINGVDHLCLEVSLKDATCTSTSESVYTGHSFGLPGGERFSHRQVDDSIYTSQVENEIQLLERYEKDYEEHLHEKESGGAERARQRYSKQIDLARSKFPREHWSFHEANLYHHTAVQKYADEKVSEAFEWIDKAISTHDRAKHRMLKAKLCHKRGLREAAIAELDHICAKWPDSKLYLDARQLKDEIASEPKGGCFIATAAYGIDYNHQLRVLYDFRDRTLTKSFMGRHCVSLYYVLSPPIARCIARSNWLREHIRKYVLDPIVFLISTRRL